MPKKYETSPKPVEFGAKKALIISNDDYSNKNKMDICATNANRVSSALDEVGFEIEKHENVPDVMASIRNFVTNLAESDLIFFVYFGHGCTYENDFYLIPADDARIENEMDIKSFGANMKHIITRFKYSTGSNAIMLIDCPKPYKLKKGSIEKQNIKIDQICDEVSSLGKFIYFSANTDDSTDYRRSPFIDSVINNLTAENIKIDEVFKHITASIQEAGVANRQILTVNKIPSERQIFLNRIRHDLVLPQNGMWSMARVSIMTGFKRPMGLAVNHRTNDIYVVDSGNHRVVAIQSGKKYKSLVAGGHGSGSKLNQLNMPTSIAFDEMSNSIIVSDSGNRRVVRWSLSKYTKKGKVLVEDISCTGVAIDHSGNIYMTDVEKHEIWQYNEWNETKTLVVGVHGRGSALNQLDYPSSIYVDGYGVLYVADMRNHRVVKWKKGAESAVVVAGLSEDGDSNQHLSTPRQIMVDSNATVYVVEETNDRITRWKKSQKTSDSLVANGKRGNRALRLSSPVGLIFDLTGNIYVADTGNNAIQRFYMFDVS